MDAHAHLLSLGWAGPGHSLDSRPSLPHKGRRGLAYDPSQNTHTGRGLVKPLLVSQKNNSFGIGKKAYEPAAGNEWWLKGFENALSNIGKNRNSEATSGAATPDTGNTSSYQGKHNGLYGYFVKGQQMEGTMQESAKGQGRGRKRKSDAFDQEEDTSTSSANHTPESTVPVEAFASKGEATTEFQQISQFMGVRDKDRKQGVRRVKISPIREFEQVGNFFVAGSERKQQRTPQIEDGNEPAASQGPDEADEADVEAPKKERRQRRKEARLHGTEVPLDMAKKEQREQGRKAAKAVARLSSINTKTSPSDPIEGVEIARAHADSSASADEALRRAERKRRKEQKRLAKAQAAS